MTVVKAEAPGLPRGRALTRDDLDAMPDDGHRYELLDGVLVVSPAPRTTHQRVVGRMWKLLDAASTPDLEPLVAPVDVVLADDTVIQPDVVLALRSELTERDLAGAPVLAVEVLWPSTRSIDLLLKKERLERAGSSHYWVVDPETPSIAAWSLVDGRYQLVGTATGNQALGISEPVTCEIVPDSLVR